jgi:hypothetical protein
VSLFTLRWNDVLATRVGNYQVHPMLGFLTDQAWIK